MNRFIYSLRLLPLNIRICKKKSYTLHNDFRVFMNIFSKNTIWIETQCFGSVRTIATDSKQLPKDTKSEFEKLNFDKNVSKFPNFDQVYLFKFARAALIFNKLKLSCFIANSINIPIVLVGYFMNWLAYNETIAISLTGLQLALSLQLNSFLCNNVIGSIYKSKESDLYKISYISVWGKRIDHDVKMNEIYNPSDIPVYIPDRICKNLYQRIKIFGYPKHLKLYKKNLSIIYDEEKLKIFFGK